MIKKLLLILLLTIPAHAHVVHFQFEQLLTELYFDVDVTSFNKECMSKLNEQYILWLHSINMSEMTKTDVIYLNRLAYMFNEIATVYHYGV
jgi:hypothetical protein